MHIYLIYIIKYICIKKKKINYHSPLKCRLHIVTSFKRVHHGKGMWEDNITVEKPDKHDLIQ